MTASVRSVLATFSCFLAVALTLMLASPASAQAVRTWVSGVGDDANPCSRTTPCKTFAGAISKTATNGEISVLDPGGFGPVTITKSITLVAEGSEGSILACGTNGINISGAGIVVNLYNLYLEGCRAGANTGIRIIDAASVVVRRATIRGFVANGIHVNPSAALKLSVSDTILTANNTAILAQPSGAGSSTIILDNVTMANNPSRGISAVGASTYWMNRSSITGSMQGLTRAAGGVIHSYGNNVLADNGADGTFTDTLPLR